MESMIGNIFFKSWQRKITALLAALIVWFFVNNSIIETKVIRNVPIRISNLPADKTIIGLLPNGILNKKINLTLTGTKDVIEALEPGDLEVDIDAASIDHNDWIAQITKKNLRSLNPSIDLANNITNVSYTEFVIKLNKLVTEKIPLTILPPVGEPPPGYEFLDIWPQHLTQMVSGPEEEVQKLKAKGLEATFDLNEITRPDLDVIKSLQLSGGNNEISFTVPSKWKVVTIPFRNSAAEEMNDPAAQLLRIDFLRQEFLAVEREVPIQVFFPVKTLNEINPEKYSLATGPYIINKMGVDLLTTPLFARNVSKLFLDIVRDNMVISILASPQSERELLPASVEILNPHDLEETYVAYMAANWGAGKMTNNLLPKRRDQLLRKRFREYLQKLALYLSPENKLNIESVIEGDKVKIINY